MKKSVAILLVAFSGLVHAESKPTTSADTASEGRGHTVFGKYCAKCHGVDADGNGKEAGKYRPPPTNFVVAGAVRPYMEDMTRKGGKAMGRSEDMPEWGGDLSEQQIQDVVNYLMSVRATK
jgi:cytochrome c oxidase cbb3-type subunit 3